MGFGHKKLVEEKSPPLSIENPAFDPNSTENIELEDKISSLHIENELPDGSSPGSSSPSDEQAPEALSDLDQSNKDNSKSSGAPNGLHQSDHEIVVPGRQALVSKGPNGCFEAPRRKWLFLTLTIILLFVAGLIACIVYFVMAHERKSGETTASASLSSRRDYSEGVLRLWGGDSKADGILEMHHRKDWVAFCDDHWSEANARVACRQLQLGDAVHHPQRRFGHASKNTADFQMAFTNVRCNGSEALLSDCEMHYITGRICESIEVVHLDCSVPDQRIVNVTLQEGNHPGLGRVMVHYNGTWGAVCNSRWTPENSLVVCRQLGYSAVFNTSVASSGIPSMDSTVPFLMDQVNCNGSEANIAQCHHLGWSQHDSCLPSMAVVVSCSNETNPNVTSSTNQTASTTAATITTSTATTTIPTTTTDPPMSVHRDDVVRLEYGERVSIGYLTIEKNGTNYTICDKQWDEPAAQVACRMTGYRGVVNSNNNKFGDWDIFSNFRDKNLYPIFPSYFHCSGSEVHFSDCRFEKRLEDCRHAHDVFLECMAQTTTTTTTTTTTPQTTTTPTTIISTASTSTTIETTTVHIPLPIRLESDYGPNWRGRLEVRYGEQWGMVCNDGWDFEDALVVCRQLNFSGVLNHNKITESWDGVRRQGPVLIKELQCDGTEDKLENCSYEVNDGPLACRQIEGIMMSCTDATPTTPKIDLANNGDLRLIGGSDDHRGRLEVFYHGVWGGVCDNGWDARDAQVACKQLSFGDVARSHSLSDDDFPDLEQNDNWFLSGLACSGNESRLMDCPPQLIGQDSNECFHSGIFSWLTNSGNEMIYLACDPDSRTITVDEKVRLLSRWNETNRGLVILAKNGEWGKVCKQDWSLEDTEVLCRHLGFPGVRSYNLTVDDLSYITDDEISIPFNANRFSCHGREDTIEDCTHVSIVDDCVKGRDEVVVECQPRNSSIFTPDSTVRLVDGADALEGRVEVLINGSWGRVCDKDDWNHEQMYAVCMEIFRYPFFTTVFPPIDTRALTAPYVAGNFNCSSNRLEESFNTCQFDSTDEYLSDCRKDASVQCLKSPIRQQ